MNFLELSKSVEEAIENIKRTLPEFCPDGSDFKLFGMIRDSDGLILIFTYLIKKADQKKTIIFRFNGDGDTNRLEKMIEHNELIQITNNMLNIFSYVPGKE